MIWGRRKKRRAPGAGAPLGHSQEEPLSLSLLKRWGRQSVSFLTLYSGYRSFGSVDPDGSGHIPYLSVRGAWVAAGEPISDPARTEALLREFALAAKKEGKVAVILPVDADSVQAAKNAGFSTYQIGSEPWHSFSSGGFDPFDLLNSIIPARKLRARGANVEMFNPLTLPPREQLSLRALTQRWLDSRKSPPLGFLNQLEPWRLSEHKRYFWVRDRHRLLGYVVAVPIYQKNAWYLVDLIRDTDSPPGTTELLVIEAMNQLKRSGASAVTLGMSPLAGLKPELLADQPIYRRIARFSYERLNSFYTFKSLYAYKEKFHPTRWEPVFVAISPSKGAGLRAMSGVMAAIYPGGMAKVSALWVARKIRSLDPWPWFERKLDERIVTRSLPATWREGLIRIRATLVLTAVNTLMFFVGTDELSRVRPRLVERMGYSWKQLGSFDGDDAKAIIVSSFLHWDWKHLAFNLFLMLTCVAILEVIAGTTLVVLAFGTGILISNPITSVIGSMLLRLAAPATYNAFVTEVDIGCSLGVFACIGALTHFLKSGWATLIATAVAVLVYTSMSHELLGLNHLTALAIGVLIVRARVPIHA